MTEPRIRAKEIRHVVTLKCTSTDLMILAELARDHKLNKAHVPFWTLTIGPVDVRVCLDHDEELMARAAQKRRARKAGLCKRQRQPHAESAEDGEEREVRTEK